MERADGLLRRRWRAGQVDQHADVEPCRRCGGTDIGPFDTTAIGLEETAAHIQQCRTCGGIVHEALSGGRDPAAQARLQRL